MKLIAFILALFFAVGSLTPECTGGTCGEEHGQEQSPEKDCCDDACFCACCGFLFLSTDLQETKKLQNEEAKEKGAFPNKSLIPASFSADTWRPPNH